MIQRSALYTAMLALMLVSTVNAQLPTARGADELDPAVNTSPDAAAPVASPARPPAASADRTAVKVAAGTPGGPEPPAAPPAGKPSSTPAAHNTPDHGPGGSDRIELGTTEISGNRELPKLLYIVPWQRAAVGKITGRPPNSLVDEVLTPIDRTVFARQNDYYAALQAASAPGASRPTGAPAAPTAAAARDEK